MTINFSGLNNSGVSEFTNRYGETLSHRFWGIPNNNKSKDKELLTTVLEKYPLPDDGFFRVKITPQDTPLENAKISINNKSIAFKDISTEDVKIVGIVKNFFKKLIKKPEQEFKLSSDYLKNEAMLNKNVGFDIKAEFSDKTAQNDYKDMMHRPDIIKDYSELFVDIINQNLEKSLT